MVGPIANGNRIHASVQLSVQGRGCGRAASSTDDPQPAANGIDFELLSPETTGPVPDALLSIEPGGLSFCDNGGAGRRFLGAIIVDLVGQFGPVTVSERE